MRRGIGIGVSPVFQNCTLVNYSAEYKAVHNSFVTKPSGALAKLQDDLVKALVAAGVWSKMDFFYMFAGHTNDNGEALKNWKNPGTFDATLVNAPAFSALNGFTGNGINAYIRTNYNPYSQGVNYTLNNAGGGFWLKLNIDNAATVAMGAANGADPYGYTFSAITRGNNSFYGRINQTLGSLSAVNVTDSRGFTVLQRTAANNTQYCKNGVVLQNDPDAATAILNREITILATNNNAGPTAFSSNQISFAYMGASFNQTELTAFYTALNGFFLSL